MGKPIVIIGANEFQEPLVLKAKEMGYETHVFAWREGAVAARSADRFYPISIRDVDAIFMECERIRPAAVATAGSDLGGVTATLLAAKLGLPGNPLSTAFAASNKYAMRLAFASHGVPAPHFARVTPEDDPVSAAEGMRLPIIVKPTDRSGSRGVMRLDSLSGLREAVIAACECSFENMAVIEEFLDGPEYSCECISQNGEHHVLAVTKKFTTGAPRYIEIGHIQPSGLDEETLAKVRSAVFAALDALGITTGASHTEFRLLKDSGEVFIIEVGARMGGDCIGSDLVALSTGYDYLRLTIEAALGLPLSLKRDESTTCQAAAVRFIFNKSDLNRLEHLENDAELSKKLVRVSDIDMGEDDSASDSSSRFGFYILACGSAEEAASLAGLDDKGE